MSDCREIFTYQGEEDGNSLALFEGLACSKAIDFVDGAGDGDGDGDNNGNRRADKDGRPAP